MCGSSTDHDPLSRIAIETRENGIHRIGEREREREQDNKNYI